MSGEYVSLYRQTLEERQRQYDAALAAGTFTPFLYPWDTLPALYLFLGVFITPRLPPRVARITQYATFLIVLIHGGYVISQRRTQWFAGGYGIGLSSAWGIIMSGAVLVCNDISRDFQRLETRPAYTGENGHASPDGSTIRSTGTSPPAGLDLTKRKVGSIYAATETKQIPSASPDMPGTQPYSLVWQAFPFHSSSYHIFEWTVDLMTSFRGAGWRHRINTLPPVDVPLPSKSASSESGKSKPTSIPDQNLRTLRSRAVKDFITCYMLLDLLKTTMITDPYFLGLGSITSPTPWHWLKVLNTFVPIATKVVRLLLAMSGVIVALTAIFSLSPLFFATILPAVIDIQRVTRAPLQEPWLYPPYWYPLSTSVARTGLAGFWGKFWHQMFRFGVSEPSRVLIKKSDLDPRGVPARLLQLLVAFGLSGSIHALGSYTSFSVQQSRPVTGPFLFFLLQGLGSFLHTAAVKLLHKSLTWTKDLPRVIGQAVNVVVVVVWLYFTGPLLADDFARCGIWLFEPVPISPLRALGFGPGGKDESWWTWYQDGFQWLGWWRGKSWWQSALAIY
jgi:hypothetical protein